MIGLYHFQCVAGRGLGFWMSSSVKVPGLEWGCPTANGAQVLSKSGDLSGNDCSILCHVRPDSGHGKNKVDLRTFDKGLSVLSDQCLQGVLVHLSQVVCCALLDSLIGCSQVSFDASWRDEPWEILVRIQE